MNDFDRFLTLQLRDMLDPVVATPAPPRKGRRPRARQPFLAIAATIELAPEAISAVEPGMATVPVSAPQA